MQVAGKEVSAVIFDMDGLLIDSEPIHRRLWQKAAADCGFELPAGLHDRLMGRGRKGALAFLKEFWGGGFNAQKMEALLLEYEQDFFGREEILPKPGANAFLCFLAAHDIKTAVATGAHRKQAFFRLGKAGFDWQPELLASSEEVSRGKPHPDVFLLAAAKLNTAPSACMVFEDSENGILGAVNAGMLAVLVPDLQSPSVEARAKALAVLPSLLEAPALFSA